jgi:hypothetical protein
MIKFTNTHTADHHAKVKSRSAVVLAIAGTILVMIACYGMMFTNNINYVIVLIFGFIVAMFGFINSK